MTVLSSSNIATPSREEVRRALMTLEAAGELRRVLLGERQSEQVDDRLRVAKLIQRVRSMRLVVLDPALFGEAAWDILLSLYIANRTGYPMFTTAVCNEAGVPQTTALRWLQQLVDTGMVERRSHPHDKRATLVELTDTGITKLDRLMDSVLDQSTSV